MPHPTKIVPRGVAGVGVPPKLKECWRETLPGSVARAKRPTSARRVRGSGVGRELGRSSARKLRIEASARGLERAPELPTAAHIGEKAGRGSLVGVETCLPHQW
jgi:hypothetical protein